MILRSKKIDAVGCRDEAWLWDCELRDMPGAIVIVSGTTAVSTMVSSPRPRWRENLDTRKESGQVHHRNVWYSYERAGNHSREDKRCCIHDRTPGTGDDGEAS